MPRPTFDEQEELNERYEEEWSDEREYVLRQIAETPPSEKTQDWFESLIFNYNLESLLTDAEAQSLRESIQYGNESDFNEEYEESRIVPETIINEVPQTCAA